jgi:hypothetical protein
MVFTSVGAEIKSPAVNDTHSFRIHDQIYHFVSPLYVYANEVNKPRCGQPYIFASADATKNGLKINQPRMYGRSNAKGGRGTGTS